MFKLSIDEKIKLEEILIDYFNGLEKFSEGLKVMINISEV